MPKENKNTSRRNRHQCPEVENESVAASSTQESIKSMIGKNRYSPFPREVPRRDIKLKKEDMALSSTETLRSMSDGIIGSGIKYIMFPLHLLRFCIFGTSSEYIASDKKKEMRQATTSNETYEPEEKRKNRDKRNTSNSETLNRRCSKKDRESSEFCSPSTAIKQNSKEEESKNDNEESTDEMVTAAEDSDSSVDHWSSASSMINMSVDYDNVSRSMPYTILEEPMDISFEEQTSEKPYFAINKLGSSRMLENSQTDATGRKSLKASVDDENSNSSVDEEIARIFQKQCTSSDDEFSFSNSKSLSSSKCEKKNFLCNGNNSRYSTSISRSKKESDDSNEKGRKKKTSSDIVANHKRRKVVDNEDKDEKQNDDKTETKARKEKRVFRQNTLNKSKPRTSKTPDKNKGSKRKDIMYKDTATQTDSAYSDEDVEMIPVETKLPEKQFRCKYAVQRLQPNIFRGTEMEQELNYVADNEDSNDGCMEIERKRISSCSTSSSSTDLGFDERVYATSNTDVAIGQWRANSSDSINTFRTCIRAPPGFPELPENPPLTSYDCNNSKYFMKTVLKDSCSNFSIVPSTVIVPPAPSPMRHLYYDYPEFMDLPVDIHSPKVLTNILRNNYYR